MKAVYNTHLSDLQYRVNIVQVQSKLIVLHIIHHPRAANIVKGFLESGNSNT